MTEKPRILSGMRPTGPLHVGHLEGALENYLSLQAGYDCFFMVADWHALTTGWADVSAMRQNVLGMVADWLAVGLDPAQAVIFRQSKVLQHAELSTLLGMLTPVPWLERCPTYKEQQQEMPDKDLSGLGFLAYPVLMAADILLYKAQVVPVGQDQLPHIELAREMLRRFNYQYCSRAAGDGKPAPVFPEPQAKLTRFPKIPGTDGRKMSKSYGNSIGLSCQGKELETQVRAMFTDPAKVRKNDPGHPEGCVVFAFHGVYSLAELPALEADCRSGALGCVDCKRRLKDRLAARLAPIQERRAKITEDHCQDVLQAGNRRAAAAAEATMAEVRSAMNMD
jgi:tryptophanyl-tRNA synthetase